MDHTVPADGALTDEPTLSPPQRAVAIYTRPAGAWGGLKERAQWWFPLLIVMLVSAASAALLHNRAIVPMMVETWDRQVASGQLQPEQVDKMERFFSSGPGIAITVAQQIIAVLILNLIVALLIWFGVSFVLGTKFRYRLALEVASWAGLVSIPGALLTTGLAWMKQTMRGVHIGFGILLPEADVPSKLQVGLGVILDALGPLAIWYVVVGILGAAALSGAPRKSVAWTLGTLYVVLVVIVAALAAMFAPAA